MTLTELAKRLREPLNGRVTVMADSVAQITLSLPPVGEAADRLESIQKAWEASRALGEHKHSCICVTCEDLRKSIDGEGKESGT